jgi:hypothetical protein
MDKANFHKFLNPTRFHFPDALRKEDIDQSSKVLRFAMFMVENIHPNRNSYNIELVQTMQTNNNGASSLWLGFVIDSFDDKRVIATCNHCVNGRNNQIFDVLSHQKVPIESILSPSGKGFGNDLAFVVTPNTAPDHLQRVVEDFDPWTLAGHYRAKSVWNVQFKTAGLFYERKPILTEKLHDGWWTMIRGKDETELGAHDVPYWVAVGYIAPWASGSPIFSEKWVVWMLFGGPKLDKDQRKQWNLGLYLPIHHILGTYYDEVKPYL